MWFQTTFRNRCVNKIEPALSYRRFLLQFSHCRSFFFTYHPKNHSLLPFSLKPIIISLYSFLCPCPRHPRRSPPSPPPISISFHKALTTAYMKSSGRMSCNVEMRTVITSPFGHRMRNAYRWLVPSTVGMI